MSLCFVVSLFPHVCFLSVLLVYSRLRVSFLGEGVEMWAKMKRRKKTEGRSGGGSRGGICGFMTNHMCSWLLYLHVSHEKEAGGTGNEEEEPLAYGSCLPG